MTAWKDSLAAWILNHPSADSKISIWRTELAGQFAQVRYKTVDPKGKVVNINLGDEQWMKPSDWAHQHIHSLLSRVTDGVARVLSIDPQGKALITLSLHGFCILPKSELDALMKERDDLTSALESQTTKVLEAQITAFKAYQRENVVVMKLNKASAMIRKVRNRLSKCVLRWLFPQIFANFNVPSIGTEGYQTVDELEAENAQHYATQMKLEKKLSGLTKPAPSKFLSRMAAAQAKANAQ